MRPHIPLFRIFRSIESRVRGAAAARLLVLCGISAIVSLLAGCDGPQKTNGTHIERGPAPSYQAIAAAYNARVADLTRLASPVSLVIDSERRGGGTTRDQLEGNLTVERPLNVALRLDKVGQTVAYLGSNDHAFWWLNVAEDPPYVAVGSHLKADPRDAAQFGLPVHPLEFAELLGVLLIPTSAEADAVRWSEDGALLEVTLPSRWGTRRLSLDPDTLAPQRIELLDPDGEVGVAAELSRYVGVSVEGKPGSGAKVASRLTVVLSDPPATLTLILADPKAPLKVKPKAFELVPLVQAYNVQRLIDLDQGAALPR